MSATESHSGRANPWLDLVRALAIVLVLFRHGARDLVAARGADGGWLETVALNGWIGVDLFFVLSGYLIARHLLRAGLGTAWFSWSRYLTLRALRILPAYYAVLMLTAAGLFPLFPVTAEGLFWRIGYHFAFLQDYLPSDINVVFWSLGVEEKFYLVAPLLILAVLRVRPAWLQAAALAALFAAPSAIRVAMFAGTGEAIAYPDFWSAYRSPFHMSLEGFVIGVGIAVAQRGGLVRPLARVGLALLVGATGMLGLWMASHEFMAVIGPFDAALQPPLISLLAGAIVLGGVILAEREMPLAGAAQAVATLAYCLYLIHLPLIPLAMAVALPYGATVFWTAYLGASIAAATLLHLAVERPFLLIKDQIAVRPGRSPLGRESALTAKA